MRLFAILLLSVILSSYQDQSKLASAPVEGLKLGDPMADFSESVYLLTGEEDIYQQYDWLRKALLKNIKNGIREGIYVGSSMDKVQDQKATQLTLFFYQKELYKVRWSFKKEDFSDLTALGETLDQFIETKYGPTSEVRPYASYEWKIWQDDTYFLQSLGDEDEYQIEYRNETIHQVVEVLE